jgi:hypothetical protein
MLYTYTAIFRPGVLNTFEAALHSAYLCLKVPATFGAITMCGSKKEARNIECGFTLGHNNVHFLRQGADQHEPRQPSSEQEIPEGLKHAIGAKDECKSASEPR